MNTREKMKERYKDVAVMAGGAAVGGGLGYLAQRGLYKAYGKELGRVPPEVRLKYLVPASTAVVGGLAVSKIMRDRERRRIEALKARRT